MKRVIVDAHLLARLHNLTEALELCDEAGHVLARIRPVCDAGLCGPLEPQVSKEELDRRSKSVGRGYTTAEVLAHLKHLEHEELARENAIAQSLNDPVLGQLEWDDRLQFWHGEVGWAGGRSVRIFISSGSASPDRATLTERLPEVRKSLERMRRSDREYRGWSAEQVLHTRWNLDEPMTAASIADLLCVASIEFWPDGSAKLYWDDQDRLFWGHNLITEVGQSGKCNQVRIEG